jgi:uncharacterized membrane protein affecting hemolysin expression
MATTTMQTSETHHIHPIRIVIAIIIGIILLVTAISLYRHNHSVTTPTQSTEQINPNSSENTPPNNSVNQGNNPAQDSTPSPNGTNGAPMSSQ